NRLLRTPAGGTQQPADMIRMVADMELFANHYCDAPGGPDLADEPKGFGTPGEQSGELCELLGAQPGRGPGRWLTVQGFDTSFARPLQPAANRALGDAQCISDGGAGPASLMECPRPQSAPLAPVPRRACLRCTHGAGVPRPGRGLLAHAGVSRCREA